MENEVSLKDEQLDHVQQLDNTLWVILNAQKPPFLYGADIKDAAKLETKTLFEILHKLEKDGFIRSQVEDIGLKLTRHYSTYEGRVFFYRDGGYTNKEAQRRIIFEQSKIDKQLQADQLKLDNDLKNSVIDTNQSMRITNNVIQKNSITQTKIFIGTLVISALTAWISWLNYTKDSDVKKRQEPSRLVSQKIIDTTKKVINLNHDTTKLH